MSDRGAGRPRVFAHRRWLLLCSATLLVFATVLAFHSRSRSEAAPLRVASGVTGGALHPIAGNFVPDKTQIADCGADPACLQQAFGNLAYFNGPKFALRLFDERQKSDKVVAIVCHRIAHAIGSASLAHFHGDVTKAYSHGTARCASGYYHGIHERAYVHVST